PGHAPGPWINQTWLYDLLCYGLYSALGGAALVFAKALLVVGLALVLLRLSQAGPGWWIPAFCTALALVAMSTRLLLQPATVSYLFLALTLWFLRDRRQVAANRPPPLLPPWPLLVLFVVWANMDRWFVLGLGTVALVWLGQILDEAFAAGGRRGGWPASLLRRGFGVALLAGVCLLNPAHVFAFALPPELGGWGGPGGSSAARLASGQVAAPVPGASFATLGRSPSGLAYFPLLGLALLSFILNLPRWPWQRFLPWLALAVLSAFQVRTVPFFAVVAGPVLAWNLQEFLARGLATARQQLP